MSGCFHAGKFSKSPAKSLSTWLSSMTWFQADLANTAWKWDDNFMKLVRVLTAASEPKRTPAIWHHYKALTFLYIDKCLSTIHILYFKDTSRVFILKNCESSIGFSLLPSRAGCDPCNEMIGFKIEIWTLKDAYFGMRKVDMLNKSKKILYRSLNVVRRYWN